MSLRIGAIFGAGCLLLVGCGGGGSSSEAANIAPSVTATSLTTDVTETRQISFSATASDSDGEITSTNWTQVSGTPAVITDADQLQLNVFAPEVSAAEDLVFEFSATDNDGANSSSQVTVTVHPNQAPSITAMSGMTVDGISQIPLTATATDTDGSIASVKWEQIAGSAAVIADEAKVSTEVILPDVLFDEALVFRFTAVDDIGDLSTQEVTINVIARKLHVLSDAASEPGKPTHVVNGRVADLQLYYDQLGSLHQSLYTADSGDSQYRIVLDPQTGDITRIIDNFTGSYATINENGDTRIDFLHFNASDQFIEGYAFYEENGSYFLAEIVGTPAFEGQISGQMNGGGQTGSYALIADETTTLANIVPVTEDILAMMTTLRVGLTPAPVARSLPDVSNGLPLTSVLKWGGMAMIAGATTSVLAPAYGAAGVAMLLASLTSNELADVIEQKFASDVPLVQEMVDVVVASLHDPRSANLSELWSDVASHLSDLAQYTNSVVSAAKTDALFFVDSENYQQQVGNTDFELDPALVPDSTDVPPVIDVDVVGQAVLQDGTIFSVNGVVTAGGELTATGETSDQSDTITINATVDETLDRVDGTFVTGDESGTIDGEPEEIGECAVSQGSGGQGTFSFAHSVGSSNGSVQFFYDAYYIPDAFTASTSDGILFDTGGLVSGSNIVSIDVESPIVFISVSAPNNGTAWEYELGCAE